MGAGRAFLLAGRLNRIKPSAVAHALVFDETRRSLLSAAGLLAGCSTLDTHLEPKTDLSQLKYVWVQQSLNDNHGLDAMIVRELQSRGIQAESGPLTLMPLTASSLHHLPGSMGLGLQGLPHLPGHHGARRARRSNHGDGRLFSPHGFSEGLRRHGAYRHWRAFQTTSRIKPAAGDWQPKSAAGCSRPSAPARVAMIGPACSSGRCPHGLPVQTPGHPPKRGCRARVFGRDPGGIHRHDRTAAGRREPNACSALALQARAVRPGKSRISRPGFPP